MEYCDRCLKYAVKQELIKKELEPQQVKEKLRISKAFPPQLYPLVFTYYNYFECPVCHWFKFKQKEIQK